MAYLTRPFTLMGFDFLAEIDYTIISPYIPAKTYDPPENCYPAEGPEWEINSIEIMLDDYSKHNYPEHTVTGAWFNQLADYFSDGIAQHIADNPVDGDWDEDYIEFENDEPFFD